MAKLIVHLENKRHESEIDAQGEPILDHLIEQGLDPPYSCQGGVCTSCKAKCLSGSAELDSNYALTDKEIEEGYILTCQAHPKTEVLEITFDAL